ncbi:MAG: L-threonylcarbamoyladenylate synthase [Gaiellaceae bacterium]|nr:L-threonylcarbamoyladenylate synthase [Gaiellaceae bacterium]
MVLPFDTVYGLAASPRDEETVRRLYRLKGRSEAQPSALVAGDLNHLFECVPELRPLTATLARILPGPVTLIVANPARRYPWLTGSNPGAIGIRVPLLPVDTAAVLERVGAVVATSANHPGGDDPRRLAAVPLDIREGAGAVLDGGELPGTPSTVIDLTGEKPRILREGALSAEEALRRLDAPVRSG